MNLTPTFPILIALGIFLSTEVRSQAVAGSHCDKLRVLVSKAFASSFQSFFASEKDITSPSHPQINHHVNEEGPLSSRILNSHNSHALINTFSRMQVGDDINGEAPEDWSGYSVDMSSDGKRVIIGADWNDGNGDKSGHARVFEEVNGEEWKQIGGDIDGEAPNDRAGGSVGISSDGKRVIVGSYRNSGNGEFSGHARVFEEVNDNWSQIGEDINGEGAGDFSGECVDMSGDGKRVIIGARFNGNRSGHARVFQEINGAWVQVGSDIDGEKNDDESGFGVSMSSDGKRVMTCWFGVNCTWMAGGTRI